MICSKCHKEIDAEEARHCMACGRDYCSECASEICECAGELGWYS